MKYILLFAIVLIVSPIRSLAQEAAPKTAKEFFNEGVRLGLAQRPEEALAAFRESLRLEPNDPTTHSNIGATLIGLNRPAEAVVEFREAVKLNPKTALFHLGLCEALGRIKEYNEAVSECQEGVKLDPEMEFGRVQLLNTMRRARAPEPDLRAAILASLNAFRASEAILLQAAQFYDETRQYDSAVESFKRLLQFSPNNAGYHARLALVYLILARDDEAITEAKKARDIDPQNVYLQYFMGRIFLILGQNRDAATAFSKVVSSDADLPDARFLLAQSEKRLGLTEKAINDLRIQTELYPEVAAYQFELGNLLNNDARYEDAISPLRKAVTLDPENLSSVTSLGLALFESAKLTEALEILNEANRKWPGNETILQFLKVANARVRYLPRVDEMKEFAEKHPDDIAVRIMLFEGLIFSRRLSEVEPVVEEIWKLGPKDLRSYLRIAAAYGTAGQREKAIDAYKRSLSFEANAAAYFGLGAYYARMGDIDAASQAYEKAIAIRPEFSPAIKLYADLLRDNGKRQKALEMYKLYLGKDWTNIGALSSACILAAQLGDMNTARNYLDLLKPLDPANARVLEQFLKHALWQ